MDDTERLFVMRAGGSPRQARMLTQTDRVGGREKGVREREWGEGEGEGGRGQSTAHRVSGSKSTKGKAAEN
jgi:hypothetical protein